MSEPLDASSPGDGSAAPSREVAALVRGEPLHELPEDLYIPPEALRVFLETFEGPLDLLLYLIRRQNLDILAINVAAVTHQYIEYVELMEASGIDLAAEYLLMAAMLAEIKSRSLLPRPPASEEEDEEDPTASLVRRLQEYEQLKRAAEGLDELPREGRDWYPAAAAPPELEVRVRHPDVALSELLGALSSLMQRADFNQAHTITREVLSTRERMMAILDRVSPDHFTPFEALFTPEEGRAGVVVTFMALLELTRERLIELIQNAPLSPIHVRGRAAHEYEEDEGEGAYEEGLSVAGSGDERHE
ncbi:condensin subunit ScpA [Kushneria sinocarnis]|uniref:Segregation and condensation protein A n=1 Tax=Kushneria sinocarnis TaxID=595502 RepID=A0A420WZ94_9GAMM|nr:ScpA family protein [Kushneria sinocarnis]RKR06668.1 condensin subunit ScpA [Kushneria sinocarnis]